jgi:hypothetical protein
VLEPIGVVASANLAYRGEIQLLSTDSSSLSTDEVNSPCVNANVHETSEDLSKNPKHPKQISKHLPRAHKLDVVLGVGLNFSSSARRS